MSDWNAALYLTFADERTRPARDLLARVPIGEVGRGIDLGCGPGNSTELLAERWPKASLSGIDTSNDMLASARKRLPRARFEKADISRWSAPNPVDLIFANAVLQWVGDHDRLFPRLMDQLAPGGVLAVQMPDNLDEPSHRLMRDTAADGPWSAKLADVERKRILPAEAYYDLLVHFSDTVDIWRTIYFHPLAGPEAIVTWLSSTGLKPFIDPLEGPEREHFLATYLARISTAYPAREDGKVILAFPRLFVVAKR